MHACSQTIRHSLISSSTYIMVKPRAQTQTRSRSLWLLMLLVVVVAAACPCPLYANDDQLKQKKMMMMNSIELAALAAIKDSLTDINPAAASNFFSSWDFTSLDPCSTFSGIACSTPSITAPDLNPPARVTILTLGTAFSKLAGSLSPSLSNLTQLTQLIVYPGLVTGPIPPDLGLLTNLRVISLTNNRLTGPLPASLSSLPNLHTLDLSYNQLTGYIPPALFELPQLKVVILTRNQLSGELPRTVSTQLLHLDLKSNRLSGRLPLSLPSSLRYLSASNNVMEGPLNGLQSLSEELVFLDLSMNQFSGAIPPSLFRPTLSSLYLQRNNLSGGLPYSQALVDPTTSTSSYGEGSIVDLSHNFLTGQVSPVLATVESLFLNNNRLVGTVPPEYVTSVYLGSMKTLYLQHNYISGFPLEPGHLPLPHTVSLCLSYNCMVPPPPVGLSACPARAGDQLSRPESQCAAFNNQTSVIR